jgi:predicted nucleic acid-binding protein
MAPCQLEAALAAARLSMDQWLAMPDSVMLAAAQRHGAVLWTQDADFDGLAGTRHLAKR